MSIVKLNNSCSGATFPGIDSVKNLLGKAATHDIQVKDEIERLAGKYSTLREPWGFVAK
jgi:hypothetical protein